MNSTTGVRDLPPCPVVIPKARKSAARNRENPEVGGARSADAARRLHGRDNGKGYACGTPQTYPRFSHDCGKRSSAEYATSKTRVASLPGVRSSSLVLLTRRVGLVEFVLRNLRRKGVEVLLALYRHQRSGTSLLVPLCCASARERTRRQHATMLNAQRFVSQDPQGLIVVAPS